MTLVAIEEHWIMPDLTAALSAMPPQVRDESLAFNEMGDHQLRLEDLGAGRIAADGRAGHRRVDPRPDAAGNPTTATRGRGCV